MNVTGSVNVTYKQQAGTPRVTIHTSDNIVDLLDIRVKNETLIVGFKKGVRISYNKLEITVTSETLNSLSVAGSGGVLLTGGLQTDALDLSVAGSGDIKADRIACNGNLKMNLSGSGDITGNQLNCNLLKVSIAGSGDIKLNKITADNAEASIAGSGIIMLDGTAHNAEYHISGSGELFATDLQAKRVSASISGSGDIRCHATEYLKARASGSGSIGYKGNPELDCPKKGIYKL